MDFLNPEELQKFENFLDSVNSDPEYLRILSILNHTGVSLPLIVCASTEEIDKPDPSRESMEQSFDAAAKDFLFIARFFHVEGKEPVILDSYRNLIYPK